MSNNNNIIYMYIWFKIWYMAHAYYYWSLTEECRLYTSQHGQENMYVFGQWHINTCLKVQECLNITGHSLINSNSFIQPSYIICAK